MKSLRLILSIFLAGFIAILILMTRDTSNATTRVDDSSYGSISSSSSYTDGHNGAYISCQSENESAINNDHTSLTLQWSCASIPAMIISSLALALRCVVGLVATIESNMERRISTMKGIHLSSSMHMLQKTAMQRRIGREKTQITLPHKYVPEDWGPDDGVVEYVVGRGVYPPTMDHLCFQRGAMEAFDAFIQSPRSISFGPDGWLYILDTGTHKVLKLDTNDFHVEHVAGFGWNYQEKGITKGLDSMYKDGKGSDAMFHTPKGISVDFRGNIIVADTENNRIRRISPDGDTRTIVGQNVHPYENVLKDLLGLDSKDIKTDIGDVAPEKYDEIERLPLYKKRLKIPIWLKGPLEKPNGVACDRHGNVYIADSGHYKIKKVSPNKHVSHVAGCGLCGWEDGPADVAKLGFIRDLAVDYDGNVFFVDPIAKGSGDNNYIRRVTPWGRVETIAGKGDFGYRDGSFSNALFGSPHAIAIDKHGNIVVCDTFGGRIRRLSRQGEVTTIAGSSEGGANGVFGFRDGKGTLAYFRYPYAIEADVNGEFWIGDAYNGMIRRLKYDPPKARESELNITQYEDSVREKYLGAHRGVDNDPASDILKEKDTVGEEYMRKLEDINLDPVTVDPDKYEGFHSRPMPAYKIQRILDTLKKAYFPKAFREYQLAEGKYKMKELLKFDEYNAVSFLKSLPRMMLKPGGIPLEHPTFTWTCSFCRYQNVPSAKVCRECGDFKPQTRKETEDRMRRVGIANLSGLIEEGILDGSMPIPARAIEKPPKLMSMSQGALETRMRKATLARAKDILSKKGYDIEDADLMKSLVKLPTRSTIAKDMEKHLTDRIKREGGVLGVAQQKKYSHLQKEDTLDEKPPSQIMMEETYAAMLAQKREIQVFRAEDYEMEDGEREEEGEEGKDAEIGGSASFGRHKGTTGVLNDASISARGRKGQARVKSKPKAKADAGDGSSSRAVSGANEDSWEQFEAEYEARTGRPPHLEDYLVDTGEPLEILDTRTLLPIPRRPLRYYKVYFATKPLGISVYKDSTRISRVGEKAHRLGIRVNDTILTIQDYHVGPLDWQEVVNIAEPPVKVALAGEDKYRLFHPSSSKSELGRGAIFNSTVPPTPAAVPKLSSEVSSLALTTAKDINALDTDAAGTRSHRPPPPTGGDDQALGTSGIARDTINLFDLPKEMRGGFEMLTSILSRMGFEENAQIDPLLTGKYEHKGGKLLYLFDTESEPGFDVQNGTITKVHPGSQAESYGVEVGWKILAINHQVVNRNQSWEEVDEEIRKKLEEAMMYLDYNIEFYRPPMPLKQALIEACKLKKQVSLTYPNKTRAFMAICAKFSHEPSVDLPSLFTADDIEVVIQIGISLPPPPFSLSFSLPLSLLLSPSLSLTHRM